MLSIWQCCSEIGNWKIMQCIHGLVLKGNWCTSGIVMNALIQMYSTNGYFRENMEIFYQFCFDDKGFYPSSEIMARLLQGCARDGLVKEGLEIFESMMRDYGMKPSMEHFGCLVDLLGRAGKHEVAETFITMMPIKPGPDVWGGALLNASVLFSDITKADKAAKMLSNLQPTSSTWRAALSNAYAAVEK